MYILSSIYTHLDRYLKILSIQTTNSADLDQTAEFTSSAIQSANSECISDL